jgi:UDP-N-acetylmuramate--alanine ligase
MPGNKLALGPAEGRTRVAGHDGGKSRGQIKMKLPRDIGPIHFVGIGGIGMSGIAEVLMNLGYTVQGSDASDNANVKRLRDKGAKVFIGHQDKNIDGADVLVVSSAIKRDNPELTAARERRLPVVLRAEMLAELMRLKSCVAVAGTHGKTTTTSLVAALLDAGNLDPTVINGGIINAYGTNARLGAGDWMVVEADESDGTFLKLPADIAIVTNVDAEHLDHFKTFAAVQEAFLAFIDNVPFYGFAVMCTDHPIVQRLVGRIEDRRIITYGENPQADVRLSGLDHIDGRSRFSVLFRNRAGETVHTIPDLALPMPGRHNALNATSAIAVAHELGIPDETIRKALANFGGVRRRFTRVGDWNGAIIIDDYGHHPVEIAAVLRAARESTKGQVIAVVQPHRYTRLQSLFEPFSTCFNDADAVIVAEVYPAGEAPIQGADRDHLVAALRARGHRQVIALSGPRELAGIVKGLARPGDYVVCLGAGSITQWAYALPGELKAMA